MPCLGDARDGGVSPPLRSMRGGGATRSRSFDPGDSRLVQEFIVWLARVLGDFSVSCLPISVFIIAKNEADRIPRSIESVMEWVDEVIVIDSGSTDATVAVSEALGATVVFNEWRGYGPQKVFGETLCRNDWLLNIDADEEVSEKLAGEIKSLFADGTSLCAGYRMGQLPMYPFQTKGNTWNINARPIRLYDKTRAGFSSAPVHDSVEVREGGACSLKGVLIHRSFRSLSHHLDKANEVSSARARDFVDRGRNPKTISLLLVPILAFLKSYFLRREFLNGVDGIVISHMYAFQRFIRLAKAREIYQLKQKHE